jgi:hypothetical protein
MSGTINIWWHWTLPKVSSIISIFLHTLKVLFNQNHSIPYFLFLSAQLKTCSASSLFFTFLLHQIVQFQLQSICFELFYLLFFTIQPDVLLSHQLMWKWRDTYITCTYTYPIIILPPSPLGESSAAEGKSSIPHHKLIRQYNQIISCPYTVHVHIRPLK